MLHESGRTISSGQYLRDSLGHPLAISGLAPTSPCLARARCAILQVLVAQACERTPVRQPVTLVFLDQRLVYPMYRTEYEHEFEQFTRIPANTAFTGPGTASWLSRTFAGIAKAWLRRPS